MSEIKISELSIGDWVEFHRIDGIWVSPPLFDKAVAKIPGVHRGAEVCLEIEPNRHFQAIPLSAIPPIPLTPEILEKNGLEKNGEYNEWNIGEWDEYPFIGVSLDRQSMRIKNLGCDIFIEGKVVYVHQLQNALRLAGVEKEIEV
jgi:hypothetical protein